MMAETPNHGQFAKGEAEMTTNHEHDWQFMRCSDQFIEIYEETLYEMKQWSIIGNETAHPRFASVERKRYDKLINGLIAQNVS